MASSTYSKTIIILDCSPKFLCPSKQNIDLEGGTHVKGKKSNSSVVYKSVWTCMAEAAVEYARIVFDLFPNENLVSIIVNAGSNTHVVNNWSEEEQSVSQVLKALANLGGPSPDDEDSPHSLVSAFTTAVQLIGEPVTTSGNTTTTEQNRGRIICLSSFKKGSDGVDAGSLSTAVVNSIKEFNSTCGKSNGQSSIQHIDLQLLNLQLAGDASTKSEKNPKCGAVLSVNVSSVKASQIVTRMSNLVQKHFALRSTTVTGIPMKEEQHSGSSANYDVEILHKTEVHHEILVFSNCAEGGVGATKKEGSMKETVFLKWSIPRSNTTVEVSYCIGAFRITPAEINSRPTACLVSFLLQGRQVLLEQPRKTGNKVISHLLSSHGGDIYIHCLTTSRSPMEDPPSISEGCGGRVTDYRINDFGDFMKSNRLAPVSWSTKNGETATDKALGRLERCTRYWPLVISDTLAFNMTQYLEPLPSLMMKESITEEDIQECKKVIYKLQGSESRNDVLPVSLMGIRGKGPKKEEQYRQLWAEIETFMESASRTSDNHAKVLAFLRGSLSPQSQSSSRTSSPLPGQSPKTVDSRGSPSSSVLAADQAWQDLDRLKSMSEREKTDYLQGDVNNDHFSKRKTFSENTKNSENVKRIKTEEISKGLGSTNGKPSLLSLWMARLKSVAASRHEEFAGRLESSGNQAELYSTNDRDGILSISTTETVKEWL